MDGMHQEFDGLPTLARGAHHDARSEACVMEYAALLSGERHSDRPRTVHSLLVQLCQVTNDVISDEARRDLVRLVPALIGTAVSSPVAQGRDEVLPAVARVLGVEVEVRARIARPEPVHPAGVSPRVDPGGGGGTAVLDRPHDPMPERGAQRRTPHQDAVSVVYGRFTMMLTTRTCDQEAVDTLEAVVHAVRAALGRPEVSTAPVWPHDVDGELGER